MNQPPRRFSVVSHGADRFGLCEQLDHFSNELWIPTHLTEQQAVEFVRQQFERTIAAELEMLEVVCETPTIKDRNQ